MGMETEISARASELYIKFKQENIVSYSSGATGKILCQGKDKIGFFVLILTLKIE